MIAYVDEYNQAIAELTIRDDINQEAIAIIQKAGFQVRQILICYRGIVLRCSGR